MFERFTEKAIKVIMLAQEEARRLGHNFVGTEQILLGLIGEGTGVAAKALKSMGVNLKDAQKSKKLSGAGQVLLRLRYRLHRAPKEFWNCHGMKQDNWGTIISELSTFY